MYKSFQFSLYMAILLIFLKASASLNQCPPRMVKQPPAGELLFEVYKSFLLECEAEGEPIPEYQWTKDGRNFDWQTKKHIILQTHGTLNFTEATSEDEGQYQCFANNTFGIASSNSAMVVENYKYLFKIKRKNEIELTAYEGEPFNITCVPIPTGRPKPTFDWLTEIQNKDSYKAHSSVNDKRMTVDPYGTLWFSYVVLNDSNTTFVFAPTMREQKLRCPTNLKVKQVENGLMNIPPEIQYVSPKNEKVLLGGEIELFCIYSGNPLPEIVWFKNGSIIKITENVKTRNYYKSLLIQNVTIEDKGSYMCNVSNNEGFKWHTIDLEVMVKPYFNIAPKIVETLKGETAEIVCEANGHPKPEIIWIHNGRPLSEELPNPRRSVTSNSMTITALTKNDTGNYGCNATNSVGYVYHDVYINLLDSSLDFHEYNAVVGKSITIGCKLFEGSKPDVKWKKDNVELFDSRYETLDNGGLHISVVDFNDTGKYICHFNNSYETESISKKLIVAESTLITFRPDKLNSTEKPQGIPQESGISEWLIGVLTIVMIFVVMGIAVCIVLYIKKKEYKVEEYEIVCDPPCMNSTTDV